MFLKKMSFHPVDYMLPMDATIKGTTIFYGQQGGVCCIEKSIRNELNLDISFGRRDRVRNAAPPEVSELLGIIMQLFKLCYIHSESFENYFKSQWTLVHPYVLTESFKRFSLRTSVLADYCVVFKDLQLSHHSKP